MSAMNYTELSYHLGHKIVCVGYGKGGKPPYENVAIECETCNEVIVSFDKVES